MYTNLNSWNRMTRFNSLSQIFLVDSRLLSKKFKSTISKCETLKIFSLLRTDGTKRSNVMLTIFYDFQSSFTLEYFFLGGGGGGTEICNIVLNCLSCPNWKIKTPHFNTQWGKSFIYARNLMLVGFCYYKGELWISKWFV